MDETERLGDRFETLDSPIARIGLHSLEDLGRSRHDGMILLVTLFCNPKNGQRSPSSNNKYTVCINHHTQTALFCI